MYYQEKMTKEMATKVILLGKSQKNLTFDQIAEADGRHPVWTASAIMGQSTMDAEEATKLINLLELNKSVADSSQEIPLKGSLDQTVPIDPLIYPPP